MLDRRRKVRDKVLYGGVAEIGERGATMDCVVRNISDARRLRRIRSGCEAARADQPEIARKGRSFLARLIWRQANRVGLAFRMMATDAAVSDLDERLRRSEIKKRQLQRRINELLGER